MNKITPVLLAGGSGTRLWPLSRKTFPKQFANILGDDSLFQKTVNRLKTSKILQFEQHMIVTHSDFRFIAMQQMAEIDQSPLAVLLEPEAKNTGASIIAASLFSFDRDPDAVILVAPSDHIIDDIEGFHIAISNGLKAVGEGYLVTFGIKPKHPETGYGYLKLGEKISPTYDLVQEFTEKPDKELAQEMLKTGDYLWNSGIFLFKASTMISAFEKYAKATLREVRKAVANAKQDLDFTRLEDEPWSNLESVSIDYQIMEKLDNLAVVQFDATWSDLGDWDALLNSSPKDHDGNVVSGHSHAIECKNSMLRSENENIEIVGIGLEDTIAVAMHDAVLVTHRNKSQDVKKIVPYLKSLNLTQADVFPKDHRPWGWFESLAIGSRFQVKRILVEPGQSLSLQSHHHRSEHWVVVSGTINVVIDTDTKILTEGESVFIPLGAIHRMENPGKVPAIVIEVQIGAYLGEDDILRYEDIYER